MSVTLSLPLAQSDRWKHLTDGFRGERPAAVEAADVLAPIVIAGIVIAALCLLYRMMRGRDRGDVSYNPKRLFRSLCRTHALSRVEQRLLWLVAKRIHPAHPAGVFVDPDGMRRSAASPEFAEHQALLRALHLRLFAGLELPDDENAEQPDKSEKAEGAQPAPLQPASG
jgi:hypothetical protein